MCPAGAQLQEPDGLPVHDAFDRRIAKTFDADGEGPQAAETTRFVCDGQHVWADFDGNGVITARYLYGDSIDQLLARYRPGDGTAWYSTDHLGTVRDMVDAAGALANTITYDSFGNILSQTTPAFGDRYTYTGREFDTETGLYYYRARYYNPSTGRFTTEDPISFAGGDANLYRYVGNSPLTATDPLGNASLVEYAKKLWAGPVGAFIRGARFQCIAWEIGGWGVSKIVFGDFTYRENDTKSLVLGALSCTFFPTSALAQGAFLVTGESLYMAVNGASALDIAESALMHTIGIAGGHGLSRYAGKAWSFLRDTGAFARIPLSGAIRRKLGDLIHYAHRTVGEMILERGGNASNVRRAGHWAHETLAKTAEAAVHHDQTAETAIKIVKQARRLGQQH